jgi:hypothetical protein
MLQKVEFNKNIMCQSTKLQNLVLWSTLDETKPRSSEHVQFGITAMINQAKLKVALIAQTSRTVSLSMNVIPGREQVGHSSQDESSS